MRKRALCCGLLMIMGGWASALAEDTLESVEKAIVEKVKQIKSLEAKMVSIMEMEMGGMHNRAETQGTYEFVRDGDKLKFRTDMKFNQVMKQGDQEQKNEGTGMQIYDGEYTWSLNEMMGQKMAQKMKASSADLMPESMLKTVRENHDLKLLPSEKVEGHDTWLLEATPKAQSGGTEGGRIHMFFDKNTGLIVKQVVFDPSGKPMSTTTFTDMKVNGNISPDRFVFKAPEGVEVMDMTAAEQPGGNPEGGKAEGGEPKKP